MNAYRGQWIAVGVIVASLGGALGAGVALRDDLFPVQVGSQAPDFLAVQARTGDTLRLDAYAGEVVLLNVGRRIARRVGRRCPPCSVYTTPWGRRD